MTPADHQREFDAFLTLNRRIRSVRPQDPPKPSQPPSVVQDAELKRLVWIEAFEAVKKDLAKAYSTKPLWMVPDA